MRILFIHNRYLQAGGEDTAVELESDLLKQHDHAVDVLYFGNNRFTSLFSKITGGMQSLYNRNSYRIVTEKINDFKPDLIHTHNLFFEASPSVLYAAAAKKIPVVATLHNYRLICANGLLLRNKMPCELCTQKTFPLQGIRHRCYRSSFTESALVTAITGLHKAKGTWVTKVSKYIALTPFAKEKIITSSLNMPEEQICIKPNFTTDFGEGASARESFFLFAGRITEEKGIKVLLNAFADLPQEKLIIAGDGPDSQSLEQQFKQYPNITFAGRKKKAELIALMKKSKALIFPSVWYEGLPFTIIEAFSTGTPVLASGIGAMKSLITDGYNGFHFTPGSSNDITRCIERFNTANNIAQFYANARTTYLSLYHPGAHYKAIMKIYQEVIDHTT